MKCYATCAQLSALTSEAPERVKWARCLHCKRRKIEWSKLERPACMQAAITRAKAVKALGAVVQASQRLLKVAEVQEGVSNALQVRVQTKS